MDNANVRLMRDSLGEVMVPTEALYGPQTQRAIMNFAFSGFRFPRAFLAALGLIKRVAAQVNSDLGLLAPGIAEAIKAAAWEVESGQHDTHFPIDIFQTGSGTSTNMNANEVIATLASARCGEAVHPNDHVNLGQSSNDVIPTAIHTSAAVEVRRCLLPALSELVAVVQSRASELDDLVKTGRTHLMDAVPITMGQELSGWAAQLRSAVERIESTLARVLELPIGGTAVGTGLNTHPRFGEGVVAGIRRDSGLEFTLSRNFFAGISSQDAALELSGQLRGLAVSLLKISNDLRLMNSGPVAGLAEISLLALQPGSSIMPGKVNPVIPEAVAMICAQVVGNDAAILMAAQSGTFQLNTMLPLIAWNLLSSIQLLTEAARALGAKAIAGFTVNTARMTELAAKNPILATALAPRIGYDLSAAIAREAFQSGRTVAEVARERTSLTDQELLELLDPAKMTRNEISP
ncbi:MAG: class II fumarate hydratase [Bryobacteraceae bacterium]